MMKRIFVVFVCFLIFTVKSYGNTFNGFKAVQICKGDTNTAILDSILRIDLSYYIGKPVDSLLIHLPASPKTLSYVGRQPPFSKESNRYL